VSLPIARALALVAVAFAALAPLDARAISFGPFALVEPSNVANQDLSIDVTPTGSISIDVAAIPHDTPQLFELTDVSITAGPLLFVLDPTLATPALGVIQPDGRFLIPTLFLRGSDGVTEFDLAIPNVSGVTYGAPDTALGLFTQFQIDDGVDVFDVAIYAAVPEPGSVLLMTIGCAALALRARKESIR